MLPTFPSLFNATMNVDTSSTPYGEFSASDSSDEGSDSGSYTSTGSESYSNSPVALGE